MAPVSISLMLRKMGRSCLRQMLIICWLSELCIAAVPNEQDSSNNVSFSWTLFSSARWATLSEKANTIGTTLTKDSGQWGVPRLGAGGYLHVNNARKQIKFSINPYFKLGLIRGESPIQVEAGIGFIKPHLFHTVSRNVSFSPFFYIDSEYYTQQGTVTQRTASTLSSKSVIRKNMIYYATLGGSFHFPIFKLRSSISPSVSRTFLTHSEAEDSNTIDKPAGWKYQLNNCINPNSHIYICINGAYTKLNDDRVSLSRVGADALIGYSFL